MTDQIRLNDKVIMQLKNCLKILCQQKESKSKHKAIRNIHKSILELEYECGLLALKQSKVKEL